MKKYFILAAAALAMVACSNDESENSLVQNGEPIRLTASVGNAAQTRAAVDLQSTAFATGEEIYVECTPSVSGSLAHAIYTTGEAATNVNALTLKTGETALRWPASGTINLDAYYPSYVNSSTTGFTVSTDQSAAGDATLQSLSTEVEGYAARELARGYKGSDLMYATTIPTQSKQDAAVGLTFNHALTKIVVNLTAGDGLTADDLAACVVTMNAKKSIGISKGKAAKQDNQYTASLDATIKMGTGPNNAAIIVPQLISATNESKVNFITVTTTGGHSVTYQLSANKTFEEGRVYTYNLTVSMKAITLQSTTITNWVDGDSGSPTASSLEI